jgi:hypothetical protein
VSEEDALLLEVATGRLAGAVSDAKREVTNEGCWAWVSAAVPAMRKMNAAPRNAMPGRLREARIFRISPISVRGPFGFLIQM